MIQRAGFRARLFFAHPSLLAPDRSTSGYALVPVRKHLAPRLREKSLAAIVKPILLQHTRRIGLSFAAPRLWFSWLTPPGLRRGLPPCAAPQLHRLLKIKRRLGCLPHRIERSYEDHHRQPLHGLFVARPSGTS